VKITLDINAALLRTAKQRAAAEGKSVSTFVEEALRGRLEAPRPAKPFRLHLLTKKGKPLAGVDLDSREALYRRMDEPQ
jgi:hypothetical protein